MRKMATSGAALAEPSPCTITMRSPPLASWATAGAETTIAANSSRTLAPVTSWPCFLISHGNPPSSTVFSLSPERALCGVNPESGDQSIKAIAGVIFVTERGTSATVVATIGMSSILSGAMSSGFRAGPTGSATFEMADAQLPLLSDKQF